MSCLVLEGESLLDISETQTISPLLFKTQNSSGNIRFLAEDLENTF